jgi:hypothetical protein
MDAQRVETVAALVLALASTTLVSFAYLREQAAVQGLPPLSLAHPAASLRRLLSDRSWLAGFLMEAGGFALYVVALALAPLALVQSVAAGGVGVLAFGQAHIARRRLTGTERLGAGLATGGLLFLGLSLIGGSVHSGAGSPLRIGAWLGATAVLAALVYLLGRRFVGGAVPYAIAGGLLFSCGDISVKAATVAGRISRSPCRRSRATCSAPRSCRSATSTAAR